MTERKLNMDQRRTENTLSTNRQSDLKKQYKDEFRDGTKVDAIHAIEDKKRGRSTSVDQIQAYRLACLLFEVTSVYYNKKVKQNNGKKKTIETKGQGRHEKCK